MQTLSESLVWLRDTLLTALPVFATGHAPAFRLGDRIVIRQGTDLLPLNLADNLGPQFYYRLNGPLRYAPQPKPLGSCQNSLSLTAPVRLVALLPSADVLMAEQALRQHHLSLVFAPQSTVRLTLSATETETARVWRQEQGNDRPLPAALLNVALLALDFELTISTQASTCSPTDPCSDVHHLNALLCPAP